MTSFCKSTKTKPRWSEVLRLSKLCDYVTTLNTLQAYLRTALVIFFEIYFMVVFHTAYMIRKPDKSGFKFNFERMPSWQRNNCLYHLKNKPTS